MIPAVLRSFPPGWKSWRTLVFIACAIVAIALGFVWVSPAAAERLIVAGGYYYILAIFVAGLVYAWQIFLRRRNVCLAWIRRPGLAGLTILAATLFAVWADSFKHKILFDEYVLQGTAWHMHATKEIGTPMRAYDISGTWLAIDTFLDKRPYFFTFLISLLHDFTGFRLENVFVLNVALAALCLGLLYWIVYVLTQQRAPAITAVALLATLPLFGQNTTGAGMEMHNLAMIAVVMVAAILYLRAPDSDRLSVLILATLLLSQSRYESVLFVGPVAVVIVLGWWRTQRLFLPWVAIVAPLLLVPYAWHDRIVNTKKALWQLREGETARFALQYLNGNLEGAGNFFFSLSPGQPNSLWLTLTGLAGGAWAFREIFRRRRFAQALPFAFTPATWVVMLCGLAISANVALLMFYYWSRFDEPVAARFALPSYLLLAIFAGWWVKAADGPGFRARYIALGGLGIWFLVIAAPSYSRRLYTTQNQVMRELEWEVERVKSRKGPVLLLTSKATMPFLLRRLPTVNIGAIRARGPQIAWHMREGTFREVLVAQVIRPTSGQGESGVDPEDVLPPEFKLTLLEQKRFGGRWIRLSRLDRIE